MVKHPPKQYSRKAIEQFAQEIVQKQQPETIQDLLLALQRQFKVPKSQSIEIIQSMLAEDRLSIHKKEIAEPRNLKEYISHPRYRWDAFIVLGPTLAILPVVVLSEDFSENVLLSAIRAMLGLIFLLFVTGFSVTSLLFPSDHDIDEIERIALSVGLSLAMAIVVGLALNYAWEISLFPILICLVLLTLGAYGLSVFIRIKGLEAFKPFYQNVTYRFLYDESGEAWPHPTSVKEYMQITYFRGELMFVLSLSLISLFSIGLTVIVEILDPLGNLLIFLGLTSLFFLTVFVTQMLLFPWILRDDVLDRLIIGVAGGLAVISVILIFSALLGRIFEIQDILLIVLCLNLLFVYETVLITISRRIASEEKQENSA
ncbi:MAG: DUF1616 domain-containing protein [Candidatus Hodarchaeales archaeon]|jgi:hypothetical protein